MEQETVEQRLTRIEERLARLEARTDDQGPQVAPLEGRLGDGADRRYLRGHAGSPSCWPARARGRGKGPRTPTRPRQSVGQQTTHTIASATASLSGAVVASAPGGHLRVMGPQGSGRVSGPCLELPCTLPISRPIRLSVETGCRELGA
jgi:hypothetical protein